MLKRSLGAVLNDTTLTFAEMQVVLSEAANVINDRPIGVKSLSQHDVMPLTPNQLTLGRTSTVPVPVLQDDVEKPDPVHLSDRQAYMEEVLNTWWQIWFRQVFVHLVPYQSYIDAKRHQNIEQGDVCLLRYDGKVRSNYRLCRVVEVKVSEDGLVRTARVQVRSRHKSDPTLPYKPRVPQFLEIGVQRLVLIVKNTDCPPEEEISDGKDDDDIPAPN